MTPSNGAKWMEKQDVSVYQNENQIPARTGKDIVESGKGFWGYLTYGLECPVLDLTVLDLRIRCIMLME